MSHFRIVQFNMQFGRLWSVTEPDRAPIDIDRTIAEIRAHAGDIVLLQEVEQGRPGGVQLNPPPNYTRLRTALVGYDSYFRYPKADPRELPFGVGLAIFSKTSLRNRFYRDLPSPPIDFEFEGKKFTPTDRVLIGAETTIAGHQLHVVNTHLLAFFMIDSSSEVHGGQRKLVMEQMRTLQGPAVIGGDFNVSKHESLLRQFSTIGYRSVQAEQVTWRRRPYVLDHVFYNEHLHLLSHSVEPTPTSDHHVLVADFEFASPA